jgi:hypothetical protein
MIHNNYANEIWLCMKLHTPQETDNFITLINLHTQEISAGISGIKRGNM